MSKPDLGVGAAHASDTMVSLAEDRTASGRGKTLEIDHCWYSGLSRHPAVVIEHEHEWGSVIAQDAEVWKLKRAGAPLSVLVSYVQVGWEKRRHETLDTEVQRVVDAVGQVWYGAEPVAPRGPLLLVLGWWWMDDPRAWLGWTYESGVTGPVSIDQFGQEHFICPHCKNTWSSWYTGQKVCFYCLRERRDSSDLGEV